MTLLNAFETLCECLITPPIVAFPDFFSRFLSRIQVVTEEERTEFTDNIEDQRKDETCSKIINYLTEGILTKKDESENPDLVKEIDLFHIKQGVLRRDFLPP